MRLSRICLLSLLTVFLLSSFSLAKSKETVFVSILPQKFFIEKIGNGLINAEAIVKPGANPVTYEPKPSQMRKLSGSRAYFAVGVPFENAWLDRIAGVNPDMKIVHTDSGIQKLRMDDHHHHDEHDHHTDDPVIESGLDPHIWLSPALVRKQVSVIADTLMELYPEYKDEVNKNLQSFLAEVEVLDQQIRAILKDKSGMKFMVFHPSWGYFAKEYGLVQVPIEIEGKNPKAGQLQELIEHAREDNIKVIFAQPQFSAKNAKIIATEIGGDVIFIDPLAEKWFENMTTVAEQLAQALK